MNSFFLQLGNTLDQLATLFASNLLSVLSLLGIFWGVFLLNRLCRGALNLLGIHPRRLCGLPGIALCPFLHGDFNHIFFNSIPLFLLMSFVLVGGWHYFLVVSISIILLSGAITWLIARPAIHIGASGLIMGYWSFLLVNTYQHPSLFSIILAILTLYYLGSLIVHLLPTGPEVSWEGHLAGFIAGIITIFALPYLLVL